MPPEWLSEYLGCKHLREGQKVNIRGQTFVVRNGIPRSLAILSAAQAQTQETFGFKWRKRETFDSELSLARMRVWLVQRYGDVQLADWLTEDNGKPLVLDAGCGAGMSALELFRDVIPRIRYLGIDVSEAVDVAAQRFSERALEAGFMQADICDLPLRPRSVDVIFSEGVLHHTNSTATAMRALSKLLKRGGKFMFYVYRRKGPVREFVDDYIRQRLQQMTPQQAWDAMASLTGLGVALGKLNAEIEIAQPIELLEIPAGRISVQRLFYWHVAKMFYHPDLSLDEMNHINYDWYAPANAHRQSPQEVREWCAESGLKIEREVVEEAGITVVATKA